MSRAFHPPSFDFLKDRKSTMRHRGLETHAVRYFTRLPFSLSPSHVVNYDDTFPVINRAPAPRHVSQQRFCALTGDPDSDEPPQPVPALLSRGELNLGRN